MSCPHISSAFVRGRLCVPNHNWTQEKGCIEKYTQNWPMKGELVKGERIRADYSHEERINTVLVMEKNVNSNVKGSCKEKARVDH